MSDVKRYTPAATIDAMTRQPIVAMGSDCGEFISGEGFFVKLADYEQLQARCAELEASRDRWQRFHGNRQIELKQLESEKAQQQEAITILEKANYAQAVEIVEAGKRYGRQQERIAEYEITISNLRSTAIDEHDWEWASRLDDLMKPTPHPAESEGK